MKKAYIRVVSYGKRVKKARKQAGFTQDDLSSAVKKLPGVDKNDFTQAYVSRVENRSDYGLTYAVHIAKVTGVNPTWLVFGEGEMFTKPELSKSNAADWSRFLLDFSRGYEERAGIKLGDNFHAEVISVGLELGLGMPVPHTSEQIEQFKQTFESVFQK